VIVQEHTVLPAWNPVMESVGLGLREVVLKVAGIDVLQNVPQDLTVLNIVPAVNLLAGWKCLYLPVSAWSQWTMDKESLRTHFSKAAANSGGSESAILQSRVLSEYHDKRPSIATTTT
jgi:hypothetical protein